jgi:hypothetical protein
MRRSGDCKRIAIGIPEELNADSGAGEYEQPVNHMKAKAQRCSVFSPFGNAICRG